MDVRFFYSIVSKKQMQSSCSALLLPQFIIQAESQLSLGTLPQKKKKIGSYTRYLYF